MNKLLGAVVDLIAEGYAALGLEELSFRADIYSLAIEGADQGITLTREALAHQGCGYEALEEGLDRLGVKSYSDYTASEHWGHMRAAFQTGHTRQCYICGSEDDVHLHHKSYESLGEESPEHLVWLCGACHGAVHTLVRVWPEHDKGPILWVAVDFLQQYMNGAAPLPRTVESFKPFDEAAVRSVIDRPRHNLALDKIDPPVYYQLLTGMKPQGVKDREYVEGICPRGGHYLRLYPEVERGWYCPTCKQAGRLGGGKIYHLARHLWREEFSSDGFTDLKVRIAKTLLGET